MFGSILDPSNGTVLVSIISSTGDFSSLSSAGPLRTPWVAQAKILLAFFFRRAFAVFTSVPAVSIISSQMIVFLPLTLPMT